MDEGINRSLKLMLKPHPISLLLSALFSLGIYAAGWTPHGGFLVVGYYLLLNIVTKLRPISIDPGQGIGDPFLSYFANNLPVLGPEQAFSEALRRSPSPALRSALLRMRNGEPLSQAMAKIKVQSKSDKALLVTISMVLYYGSEETSRRLKRYLEYREERRKVVSEYTGKMAILSLRLKVLSIIASASLAVIAFASPLLGSLTSLSPSHGHYSFYNDGIFSFLAFLSLSILSPFLYSRMVPDTNGARLSALSGVLFILVYLVLRLTIG